MVRVSCAVLCGLGAKQNKAMKDAEVQNLKDFAHDSALHHGNNFFKNKALDCAAKIPGAGGSN